MADVKKIATRESYGNTLKELAAEGHDDLVVLDADLAAATKTGMFRKAYPDRHFDCGIAEGNMMGVATGLMVNEARIAAEQLAAEGIHARVINIHTIKPLDEEIVLKAAKECGKVITAEEHNVIGGLGEAVCAVLSEKLPTPVRRVGVQDVFGCSGPAWDLLAKYGLDAATICKTAHEMLNK